MGRKIFSTTLDEQLQRDFKVACAKEGKGMNEVLEQLMRDFIERPNEE